MGEVGSHIPEMKKMCAHQEVAINVMFGGKTTAGNIVTFADVYVPK